VLDMEERIVFWNRGAEERYGWTKADVLGQMLHTLLHTQFPQPLTEIRGVLLEQGRWEGELVQTTRAGTPIVVASRWALQRDAAGHPVAILESSNDITEYKRLEDHLRQSQKIEAIGTLAGGIAHDFNNLLTAITGYTALAQDTLPPNHAAHADLRESQRAAERASTLTSQLLAFARKRVIEPSVFSLNDLILDMESLLRRLIGEDIALLMRPSASLGLVRADPGQIEQVLVNLVVNARDAMPDGGTLIVTTADAPLDEAYAHQHVGAIAGAYVRLSVRDTGIGMSREVQAHVFEPFYTTKEHSQGTGLGLATCYGIVKQHGGYIWFSSEPGQGTIFEVYLPRVDGPADVLPLRSEQAKLPSGNETVLLVEDEQTLRELTARMLRNLGYDVLEASDGLEALAIVRAQSRPIQLLLTDVVMPQMRGNVLAEQLIALSPATRLLFMSGYTGSALDLQDWLGTHVAFLQKPFSPAMLANKVREVLDA
jgi:two-component system cell cycle sensor histidine kinase/response regulator CckA